MQLSVDGQQCGLVVKHQNTQHTGHERAKSSGVKVEPNAAQEEYVKTLLHGKPTVVAKNSVIMYAIQEGITTLQTMQQVDNYIKVRAAFPPPSSPPPSSSSSSIAAAAAASPPPLGTITTTAVLTRRH